MQYWLGITGLALNLVGAMIVAWTDSRFSRAVDYSISALELNFNNLKSLLGAGGGTALILTGLDTHREIIRSRVLWPKRLGWLILIAGYVLQVIAVWIVMNQPSGQAG